VAGLQDWLGGKARSGLDAYLAWRDGPSALRRLDTAFPQAEPVPGKSVAEVAPPRTSLSDEQADAMGSFLWEGGTKPAAGGLDLSQAARMGRARDMGFNTDKVVYHGSPSPGIEAFDPNLLGASTKAASAKKGFFFASEPVTPHSYGNDYMDYSDPQYLSKLKWHTDKRDALNREISSHYYNSPIMSRYNEMQGRYQDLANQWDAARNPAKKAALQQEFQKTQDMLAAFDQNPEMVDFRAKVAPLEEQAARFDTYLKNIQPPWSKDLTVYPAYLKYSNPLEHDFKGERYRDVTYSDLLTKAKRGRRDAVIMRNTYDGGPLTDVHVVFKPEQIRSAFAKFDPAKASSGDILAGVAPAVAGAGLGIEAYRERDDGR
jgi:hypothetical protein